MKTPSIPVLPACLMLLALLPAQAYADAQVHFVRPEAFSDAGGTVRDRDETLKLIERHIKQQAEKYAPGETLVIEVTDLDLAGEIEPYTSRMDRVRVLRSITWPKIDLRYVVSVDGKQSKQGEVRLSDTAYQDRMPRYSSGDPIRYEKQLLDDWFKQTFLVPKPQRP